MCCLRCLSGESEPFRVALLDRPQRLVGNPGEGLNLFFQGERLGRAGVCPRLGKVGGGLACAGAGAGQESRDAGSLDHVRRQLIIHTSPTKRSSDFIAHLEQLDRLFGPQPGRQAKPVVLVEDNGPIHTSKRSLAALAARAHWHTVEWLPKYAPELNEIEPVWRDLKAHHLAHQTFTDVAALDQAMMSDQCSRSSGHARLEL